MLGRTTRTEPGLTTCDLWEESQKVLPVPQDSAEAAGLRLRNFEDFYGFRGTHPEVYYLSPWEFLMLWEVRRLPKKGPSTDLPREAATQPGVPKTPLVHLKLKSP